MISDGTPILNSTAVSRRCSSFSVATSLKIGMTMDRRGLTALLRDMANTPSDDVGQVMADQFDARAHDRGARLQAAQELHFPFARREQASAGLRQRGVQVAGMHHQLGHARTEPSKQGV